MLRAAALVGSLALGGCASAGAPSIQQTHLPTHADPPAYTPSARAEAHSGEVTGLSLRGDEDQAVWTTLRFLEAVRAGDEESLRAVLSEGLVSLRSRSSHPRSSVIHAMLRNPIRRRLDTDKPLEHFVRADALDVEAVARAYGPKGPPAGMLPTDLVVTVPVRLDADDGLRHLLGWVRTGRVVVRPGLPPQVVGF